MALTIEVKGDSVLSDGSTDFGRCPADDTVEIEVEQFEKRIHTTEGGPEMPRKIINLGKMAVIRATLVDFDRSAFAAKVLEANASNMGEIGDLGADRTEWQLVITPSISGATIYTFPKVRLLNIRDADWGNTENRFAIVLQAQPDRTALGTATTALWTETTVV